MSAHMSDPDRFHGCTYCGGAGCSECKPPEEPCSWCGGEEHQFCVCDEAPVVAHPDGGW